MPSKLLNRLSPVLDETIATKVMNVGSNPTATLHWPIGNFGNALTPQSVVIHETSGYPTYQSADTFLSLYTERSHNNEYGIGPHFYVSGNGATYRLIDIDPAHITSHAGYMNGVSLGIENGDLGDNGEIGPDASVAGNRRYWRSFSTNPAAPNDPTQPEDLTGLKAHLLLHPINHLGQATEDTTPAEGVLIWFGTANYQGPQNELQVTRSFRRMLFTERDFRSLVLLCRYLAEQLGIPRNFPVLPYLTMDMQSNPATDAATEQKLTAQFRQFILCDERANMLATAAGTTIDLVTTNDPTLPGWFHGQDRLLQATDKNGHTLNFWHNEAWTHMFSDSSNGYRGFVGHGFVGDTAARDSHSMCPGPYFDWHRFAREVWDWWWYPFDFTLTPPATSQTQREYRKARSTTPLRDYCFDAEGTSDDYQGLRLKINDLVNGANTFTLSNQTPVYAMANGTLVAARIATNSANPGFVLIRHEVFHQTQANRIDYDRDPTYVYSLTYYLDNLGNAIDNVSDQNPDWFNRFMMRLKETELAVDFHTNHLDNALRNAWARVPAGGGGTRLSFGDQTARDALFYRQAANDLAQGNVALFPLELQPGATPVRVALGDFLGFPGAVGTNQTGVLIDIFSVDQLPPFSMIPTTTMVGRQLASSFTQASWWAQVCGFVALEMDPDKELPFDGTLWHYDTVDFLAWINQITWQSEWLKYNILDMQHPNGPPRPKSRR